ncbi:MAG: MBL fold metallo-hydrolase [Muribaculaceae bacterium]|nr:MBL fold metallo-hydrolase [Muribaculaceae bacterium]
MKIKQFVNNVFTSNSFVVHDDRNAVIIDVGDFTPIQEYLVSQGLALRAVFITHTHYDHIYGVGDLMAAYPEVPVYTSEFGKRAFGEPGWNFSRYHDTHICIISDKIISLQDNVQVSAFEGVSILAIRTPGHDESCMSYLCDNALFTGDSYIPDVKVIATFPRSDKTLARHWYDRLSAMSDKYDIYPGHGPVRIIDPDQ